MDGRQIILSVAVLTALGAAAAVAAMGNMPKAETAPEAALRVCELRVDGMTCGGCERAVKKVLAKENGFAGAEVSHKNGSATIRYDPAKTSPEKLAALITKGTGYPARVKEGQP